MMIQVCAAYAALILVERAVGVGIHVGHADSRVKSVYALIEFARWRLCILIYGDIAWLMCGPWALGGRQ